MMNHHKYCAVLLAVGWGVASAFVMPTFAQEAVLPEEKEFTARDRVTKGTLEFGALVGYWKAFDAFHNPPSTNREAVYFLGQVGQVLTEEIGSGGWFGGNVEIFIEPMAAYYWEPFDASAFGATLNFKYNFLDFGRWMPFWEGGAGGLWTDLAPDIEEQSTKWNFILQTGIGTSYFVNPNMALTTGLRFHHISNANLGDRNTGINAWQVNVGVSFFSP